MFDKTKNWLRSTLIRSLGIQNQTTTLREPASWLLDMLGGETSSGVRATQSKAYSLSAYYCGVRIISETLGSLPLNVYRRTRGTRPGREVAWQHPVQNLLHKEPNPEMTAMVFRESIAANVIDWGNCYVEIARDSAGTPIGLWPLSPRETWPKRADDGTLYYETWVAGTQYFLRAENVLHIPGLGYDGRKGYPLIQLAAETIGLHVSQRDYSGTFFKNGGHVSMVAETDGHLDDAGFARLKEQLQSNVGGLSNAHRIALLEYGVKLRSTNMSHEDAQMVESMKFSIEEWARWFNIPPHKLKDLANAHFTNIEHQNIEWVTDSIRPWAIRFEQEFDKKLFFQKNTFYTKHVVEGLLRGDLKSRYDAYAVARNWGWMSANDVLELEDRNPLPGDIGDKYLIPLNMIPADQLGKEPPRQPATPPPEDPDDDRTLKLLEASAQRVVNYEHRRIDRLNAFETYNDGELAYKINTWLVTNYDISERYLRIAEQLNLIADDQGISDDELTACKVRLLIRLVTDNEVTDETIYKTAFA